MALSITFYNDVKYTKDDFMNRDRDFFGNGVVKATDFPLSFPATPDLTFQVGAGVAWVDGYRIANDATHIELTVPPASSLPRIDIVQIGHDDFHSVASLVLKQGVPDAEPIEPGADPGYLKLYAIQVDANVLTVSEANVSDRRTLVPLNVSGTQISFAGAATTGANTFTDTQTAPEFIATSQTAPLQMPNLAALPAQAGAAGTVCIVNGHWYMSDGAQWNQMSPPYVLPADVAKIDLAQTWTAVQTWAPGQQFSWAGVTGAPTSVDGFGITDAVKKTGDTMTGALGLIEGSTLAGRDSVPNYDQYLTSPDSYGVYTVLQLKRPDGTLYMKSTLSNPDANGNYQTDTWQFYDSTGATVVKTHVWSITWDSNNKASQKVMKS